MYFLNPYQNHHCDETFLAWHKRCDGNLLTCQAEIGKWVSGDLVGDVTVQVFAESLTSKLRIGIWMTTKVRICAKDDRPFLLLPLVFLFLNLNPPATMGEVLPILLDGIVLAPLSENSVIRVWRIIWGDTRKQQCWICLAPIHAMIASVWILYLFDKVLLEAAGSVLNLRDQVGLGQLSFLSRPEPSGVSGWFANLVAINKSNHNLWTTSKLFWIQTT